MAVLVQRKPRVGIFDFTGCEGCQLSLLELGPEFSRLLDLIDLVECREFSSSEGGALDVALIEGSISSAADEARLQRIRDRSRILIALGACADTGGVHALGYAWDRASLGEQVYGNPAHAGQCGHPRPVSDLVNVDFRLPGCPPQPGEFLELMQAILLQKSPELPGYAVCVDCKLEEYPCTFGRGVTCLGPVTRGGCRAVCIAGGDRCRGCRGEIENPRSTPYYRILTDQGLTAEEITAEYRAFNLAALRRRDDEDQA